MLFQTAIFVRMIGLLLAGGCMPPVLEPTPSPTPSTYIWNLPAGFPRPVVPTDNPMSAEKVALGRRLFFDPRLSGNGTQACASCHQRDHGFSDPGATSTGSTGDFTTSNATCVC
jgi:cytochrome c peroxidase